MSRRYTELVQRKRDLMNEARDLIDLPERSGSQESRLDEIAEQMEVLGPNIAREERINALEANMTPVRDLEPPEATLGPRSLPTPFKALNWKTGLGEQLISVAHYATSAGRVLDKRLLDIQAAIGSSEGSGSDGGWLVQTDFSNQLLDLTHQTGVLVGRVDNTPIGPDFNGLKMNAVDETSRVNGSRWGGVLAYWQGEAATLTASRPKFRVVELNLQKLTGLYYATDELLKDASALGDLAAKAFGEEFGFKIDDAIIRGSGAGEPLGILGHSGTVTVAKETAQAGGSKVVIKENIQNMYSRMLTRSKSRAEWFINTDVWPSLFNLAAVVGSGGSPVFIPPGGLSAAPYGTLLGRPIVELEQCETVGTEGDIIFADFSEYKSIDKGGIEAASSIHVQFLTDETVFRFILRMDGQPKRQLPITPYKGTTTQSPFVTLAVR